MGAPVLAAGAATAATTTARPIVRLIFARLNP